MMRGPSFLTVYHRDGTSIDVGLEYAPVIEAAVTRYLGEGGNRFVDDEQRDTLLRLRMPTGRHYCVLASSIYSWLPSTPESRAAQRVFDAALEAERDRAEAAEQAKAGDAAGDTEDHAAPSDAVASPTTHGERHG
jgi:hypothetical protein